MFAMVHYDQLKGKTPEQWDELKIDSAYVFWYLVNLDTVDPKCKYIELDTYTAKGCIFAGSIFRGYMTRYENSNIFNYIPFEKWVDYPKKNKHGVVVPFPKRYKYTLTEKDIKQGTAFVDYMEPYVQRAFKSQTRRKKYVRFYRLLGRVQRLFI
jgi:hypothetical protein